MSAKDAATLLNDLRQDLQNTTTTLQNMENRLSKVEQSMQNLDTILGPAVDPDSPKTGQQPDPLEIRLTRIDHNLIEIGKALGANVQEPTDS